MIAGLAVSALAHVSAVPSRPVPPPPDACYVVARGERLFVGSGDCLRKLPAHDASGFLLLGPEEACFAAGGRQVRAAIAGACETALLARTGVLPIRNDGVRRLYRATLRVTGDGRKGLYGKGGVYPSGYYVLQVRSARFVRRL